MTEGFRFVPASKVIYTKEPLTTGPGLLARVTINDPTKLNRLEPEILVNLKDAFINLSADPDIRFIILTGAIDTKDLNRAPAFSSGADIKTMAFLHHPDDARTFIRSVQKVCQAIRDCPAIVIARIHGVCYGAALEIAASCDFRFATSTSTLGMPETKLGIPSVVEARMLANLIGWPQMRFMLYSGSHITGKEAKKLGLVDFAFGSGIADPEVEGEEDAPEHLKLRKVYYGADLSVERSMSFEDRVSYEAEMVGEMDDTIRQTINSMAANGPEAMKAQKRLIKVWEESHVTEGIEAGVDSFASMFNDGGSEPRTYMGAFLEETKRRKEDFKMRREAALGGGVANVEDATKSRPEDATKMKPGDAALIKKLVKLDKDAAAERRAIAMERLAAKKEAYAERKRQEREEIATEIRRVVREEVFAQLQLVQKKKEAKTDKQAAMNETVTDYKTKGKHEDSEVEEDGAKYYERRTAEEETWEKGYVKEVTTKKEEEAAGRTR